MSIPGNNYARLFSRAATRDKDSRFFSGRRSITNACRLRLIAAALSRSRDPTIMNRYARAPAHIHKCICKLKRQSILWKRPSSPDWRGSFHRFHFASQRRHENPGYTRVHVGANSRKGQCLLPTSGSKSISPHSLTPSPLSFSLQSLTVSEAGEQTRAERPTNPRLLFLTSSTAK